MTSTLIEKLEALPFFMVANSPCVPVDDVRKMLEQAKAEKAEPVELEKLAQDLWLAADCLRNRHTNKALANRFVGYYLDVVHKRIAPHPTPQDEKDKQIERLKAAFHLNMVRAYPEKSHAEIEAAIEQAMKGAND